MSDSRKSRSLAHLKLLFRLDATRLTSLVRRPTASTLVAGAIPFIAVFGGLWIVGRTASGAAEGLATGATLGIFVSAGVAFLAYGVLFGGSDDGFLRRLGADSRALLVERALRLAAIAAVIIVGLLVPVVSAGAAVGPPAVVALGAGLAAIGVAVVAMVWSGRATIERSATAFGAGIRQFDPGLARAGALVYAPLVPFLAGSALGFWFGSASPWALLLLAPLALFTAGVVLRAAEMFASIAPRLIPYTREISYSPPPEGGESFHVGRGLSALLPRRAAAVWVRDATVAGRRFTWAGRVTWPVGIVAIATLARWGEDPVTRLWVVVAVGAALVVQGAAIIGLGRLERSGTRWFDRAGGLRGWERFLGRWTWGWGLSLWLLVPTALAWYWWSGVSGAWLWPIAGAVSAAIAVTASLAEGARR
jgi:hypothetical protein